MPTSNVHDRHDTPTEDDVADQNTPSKSKTTQKVRDAHFFEDGVKANGQGGKAPKVDSGEVEE